MPEPKTKTKDYWEGFKAACEIIDDMYARSNTHPYMQGDCVMAKMNLFKKEDIRKNPFYKKAEVGSDKD
jgi:hypothetical protein